MSRTVEEWVGKHDDAAIPPRVRDRVALRSHGHCMKCGLRTVKVPGQCDHITPLILGGEHRETNLQWLCVPCHAAKTRLDVKLKSKVARVRKKHIGIKKPRTIRAWRKFNGEIVYAGRER